MMMKIEQKKDLWKKEASEYSQQHRRQKRLIWWNSDPSKSQQGVPQAVAAST